MCLSLAGRIRDIDGEHAVVVVDGSARRVSLAMLLIEGRPVAPGDWVLIHTGFAVEVLDAEEGGELARLWRELEATRGEAPDEEVRP
jgi:hydrogenase expression/formation protein HypC